jgi:hypothetical protein
MEDVTARCAKLHHQVLYHTTCNTNQNIRCTFADALVQNVRSVCGHADMENHLMTLIDFACIIPLGARELILAEMSVKPEVSSM